MSAIELFAILRPVLGPLNDGAITGWTWEVWANAGREGDERWSSKMLDHGGPGPSGNAGAEAAKCIGSYNRLLAFAGVGFQREKRRMSAHEADPFLYFQYKMAANSTYCCVASPGPGARLLCTEPIGHEGDHIAGGPDDEVIRRWPS